MVARREAQPQPDDNTRVYSDEEIAEFMEADRLSPEFTEWLRNRMPPQARRFWDPDHPGLS